MNERKILQVSVIVSFSLHASVILGSRFIPFVRFDETDKKIQVTYIKIEEEKVSLKPKDILKTEVSKKPPPPFIDPENIKIKNEISAPKAIEPLKPDLSKPGFTLPVNKKVVLPAVELSKIDNPSYLTYYQIVREKIRRAAYQGYTRRETGEVYVSFSVFRDGRLGDVALVEERSSSSYYLKDIALSSLRHASPFPVFPKDLDYPFLSFNVAISFETD